MTIKERQQLIENYMPLANSLAWKKCRITPNCVDIDELKSAAYMGLVDAASRFDFSYGVAFGVYAKRRIWGEICDYLRQLQWGGRSAVSMMSIDESMCVSYVQGEQNEFFDLVTKNLNAIGSRLVKMYYREGYTMKEIGEVENLSESRVSQILKVCRKDIESSCDLSKLTSEIAA